MAANDLQIVVRAVDAASATLKKVRGEIEAVGGQAQSTAPKFERFKNGLQSSTGALATIGLTAGLAMAGLVAEMNRSVDAANRQQAAMIGLTSVSRAFRQDAGASTEAARRLARDGLMTVGEAATGLKNLLASGFSLDQAVTLMNRFKDSAAFGRQSALGFGQAVSSATEGIKNGNSILVDNAGVTKNLSVILEEAGFSAQDLMKATTDASIRQALFNGILKETNPQLGDAGRLAETFAGKQAMLATQTDMLRARIGEALQPVLLQLLTVVTPLVEKVAAWVQELPRLTATLIASIGAFAAVASVVAGVALAVAAVVAAFGAAAAGIAAAVAVGIAAVVGFAVAVALNFNKVKAIIAGLPPWVRAALAGLADALIAPFRTAFGPIIGMITRIYDAVGGLKGIANGAKDLGKQLHIPGFASGVDNFRGGLAVVGERGPELVSLPKGASVYSHEESQRMAGVTINPTYHIYNQVDMDAANRELGWRLASV